MIEVAVASALVALGVYGVLVRRDLIGILAAIEVMMAGALLVLVAFGSANARAAGVATGTRVEGTALLVLVIAAAEAAVGFALLVALAKRRGTTRVDDLTEVKG